MLLLMVRFSVCCSLEKRVSHMMFWYVANFIGWQRKRDSNAKILTNDEYVSENHIMRFTFIIYCSKYSHQMIFFLIKTTYSFDVCIAILTVFQSFQNILSISSARVWVNFPFLRAINSLMWQQKQMRKKPTQSNHLSSWHSSSILSASCTHRKL